MFGKAPWCFFGLPFAPESKYNKICIGENCGYCCWYHNCFSFEQEHNRCILNPKDLQPSELIQSKAKSSNKVRLEILWYVKTKQIGQKSLYQWSIAVLGHMNVESCLLLSQTISS